MAPLHRGVSVDRVMARTRTDQPVGGDGGSVVPRVRCVSFCGGGDADLEPSLIHPCGNVDNSASATATNDGTASVGPVRIVVQC
jgi:hypothetical protein